MIVYLPANSQHSAMRHGGVRRTEQIASTTDFDFRLDPLGFKNESFGRLFFWFVVGIFFTPIQFDITNYLRSAICIGRLKLFLISVNFFKNKENYIALEMGVGMQLEVGSYLARNNYRYIVFPHNIEYLVSGQRNSNIGTFIKFAAREILIYAKAMHCFCISELDFSVVAPINPNTSVYPYYPSKLDLQRFLEISNRREIAKNNSFFLCLGSAGNPPTRQGIGVVIEFFNRKEEFDKVLKVAGYGTESFGKIQARNVEILGGISDKELDILLINVKAVILYQPPTTGFLTKLMELNLCGVPVLVNREYIQARGMESYGIYTYDSISDIDLLVGQLGEKCKKFEPPKRIIFEESIRSLVTLKN